MKECHWSEEELFYCSEFEIGNNETTNYERKEKVKKITCPQMLRMIMWTECWVLQSSWKWRFSANGSHSRKWVFLTNLYSKSKNPEINLKAMFWDYLKFLLTKNPPIASPSLRFEKWIEWIHKYRWFDNDKMSSFGDEDIFQEPSAGTEPEIWTSTSLEENEWGLKSRTKHNNKFMHSKIKKQAQ
jgi:hypothetical protein